MDDAFGRVLRALDDAGLADDTLVLCFSDHGLQFPRNMCNLTDQGIGVFLVARGPGGFEGGRVIDAMVSLIDLAPTAYAAAGIDVPDFVQGMPLQPLARGAVGALHEEIHAEINYHAAYEPARCVRTERYKYIRRYDRYERVVLSNADDGRARRSCSPAAGSSCRASASCCTTSRSTPRNRTTSSPVPTWRRSPPICAAGSIAGWRPPATRCSPAAGSTRRPARASPAPWPARRCEMMDAMQLDHAQAAMPAGGTGP